MEMNADSVKEIALSQVVSVAIQGTVCAIDLIWVERVLPLLALQSLPGGHDSVAGLMDYHGDSCVVVDLATYLGRPGTKPYTLDTPIILCTDGLTRVGFIVDEVLQIDAVESTLMQMQRQFKESASFFLGEIRVSTGLVLLLDMQRLLTFNFIAKQPSGDDHHLERLV